MLTLKKKYIEYTSEQLVTKMVETSVSNSLVVDNNKTFNNYEQIKDEVDFYIFDFDGNQLYLDNIGFTNEDLYYGLDGLIKSFMSLNFKITNKPDGDFLTNVNKFIIYDDYFYDINEKLRDVSLIPLIFRMSKSDAKNKVGTKLRIYDTIWQTLFMLPMFFDAKNGKLHRLHVNPSVPYHKQRIVTNINSDYTYSYDTSNLDVDISSPSILKIKLYANI
jgi:hypothetical protein